MFDILFFISIFLPHTELSFSPTDNTDNSDFSFSLFLMRCCFARRATDNTDITRFAMFEHKFYRKKLKNLRFNGQQTFTICKYNDFFIKHKIINYFYNRLVSSTIVAIKKNRKLFYFLVDKSKKISNFVNQIKISLL